jgi:hypothetical protein
MLNNESMCSLLMLLVGPFSGLAAAEAHKASLLSAIVCAFVGLAVAFGVAAVSHKFVDAVYKWKGKALRGAAQFFAILLIPLFGVLATFLLPFFLIGIFYK